MVVKQNKGYSYVECLTSLAERELASNKNGGGAQRDTKNRKDFRNGPKCLLARIFAWKPTQIQESKKEDMHNLESIEIPLPPIIQLCEETSNMLFIGFRTILSGVAQFTTNCIATNKFNGRS